MGLQQSEVIFTLYITIVGVEENNIFTLENTIGDTTTPSMFVNIKSIHSKVFQEYITNKYNNYYINTASIHP